MMYTFQPKGVCARGMQFEVDEQGIIRSFQAVGGCNGNLQGLGALVVGMKAEEAITRMKGIKCGNKATSCPDQFAQGLEKALAEQPAE